jgi:hypothetical protein
MAQMQALLKIKADVEGSGAVQALGRSITGLGSAASRVSGSLRGLSGALGSMASLAAGAGLLALAKNAIDTADNLRDMSIRTGVSVEQLSKLKTAAEMSGATIEDVGKGLAKTAIAIGNSTSAASNATATAVAGGTAKLKTSIADQLRILEQADARKVTTIKTGAERQIQAVRDGEQRQVEAIERAKDQRIAVIERESDRRMREINRRYRQEEKLLNDSFDDQRDAERRKTDESLNRLEREINRRYELLQKQVQDNETLGANAKDAAVQALRDQQDAELATLRQGFTDRTKAQDRNYRDQQEAAQQAIDDRRAAEQAAEQAATDARKKQADDSAKAEKAIMAKASAERIAQIKAMADAQVKAIEDGNKKAQDAYAKLGIALRNQDGSQRGAGEVFMDVFDALAKLPTEADRAAAAFDLFGGKLATKLLPLFAMTREEVEKLVPIFTTEFANSADSLNDAEVKMSGSLLRLGAAIGNVLMPLTAVLEAFTQLPGPLQTIIGSIVLLGPAILIVANVIKGLMALKIFATIAGLAGVLQGLVPIVFGLKTAFLIAFQGIWAFLSSSFIPAIVAFFSGPVGWTVLAVAAVVAMAILFRKPLQDFAGWLVSWGKPISQFFTDYITTPISKAWQSMVDFLPKALNVAATTIKNVFTGVGTAIKGVLNGILRGVFNSVNGAIENINRLIRATNAISAKVGGPRFDQLPTLKVPQFAKGGYVGAGTLAVVGEAGPEYIVPERKAAAFAMNYLNGARGGAAIPAFANGGFVGGGSASGGFVGGNAQINVTTGPVMQQGGQQYVSMADLERAMRKTADGVYASLRTPAGRRAAGVR